METRPTKWRYSLTDQGKSGILKVVDSYAICPVCGRKKLARITPRTVIADAGLWCKICGEVRITIEREP